jgi:hypothetical protein
MGTPLLETACCNASCVRDYSSILGSANQMAEVLFITNLLLMMGCAKAMPCCAA